MTENTKDKTVVEEKTTVETIAEVSPKAEKPKTEKETKTPVKTVKEKGSIAIDRDFFIKLGIFTTFIAVIFGILIYSAILSRKSWQKNLKTCVEEVLDEKDSNNWTVGNAKTISNTVSVNAVCYEATNRKTGQIYTAVLMRVVTFYGPISVVFTVDDDENVEMVGFSSVKGRIAYNLISNRYSKRFEYWEKKIPEIIR